MSRKSKVMSAFIAAFAFIVFCHSYCEAWKGQVVGVVSGDLFTIAHEGRVDKIRLYGVESPKWGQPFKDDSVALASHLALQKMVEVTPLFKGYDGIENALIRIDGSKDFLNVQLISHGFAWVKPKECSAHICAEWRGLENLARSNAIGLWADPAPIPPWEWQKEQRLKILERSQQQEKAVK
jgi:endonuclease YncB( thermonuclease family)